jgi:hypothetical protein
MEASEGSEELGPRDQGSSGQTFDVVHHLSTCKSGAAESWLLVRSALRHDSVGRHDSRQVPHMEDKMHEWDVQHMLVNTRCLRINIMSLSKCLPQSPSTWQDVFPIGQVGSQFLRSSLSKL